MRALQIIMIGIIFISCKKQERNQNDNCYEVTDFYGREVCVPEEVGKIICLNPGALRFVSCFDVKEKIVAVEQDEKELKAPYVFAFPEIQDIPVIGKNRLIEAELVAASNADIIFSTFYTPEQADNLELKTGIPVYSFHYGDINSGMGAFEKAIKEIGNILGLKERALELINGIRMIEKDLMNRVNDVEEVQTAYICGIAYKGAQGFTSTEPFYKPFNLVKTENVAGEVSEQLINPVKGTFIELEKLSEWNPEYIFIDASGLSIVKSEIQRNPDFYKNLQAFRKDNLFIVYPYNWYALNYSTLLVNAYFIGKTVYPECFEDVDINEKANEIYSLFFRKGVNRQMKGYFNGFRKINPEELFEN